MEGPSTPVPLEGSFRRTPLTRSSPLEHSQEEFFVFAPKCSSKATGSVVSRLFMFFIFVLLHFLFYCIFFIVFWEIVHGHLLCSVPFPLDWFCFLLQSLETVDVLYS